MIVVVCILVIVFLYHYYSSECTYVPSLTSGYFMVIHSYHSLPLAYSMLIELTCLHKLLAMFSSRGVAACVDDRSDHPTPPSLRGMDSPSQHLLRGESISLKQGASG